MASIRYTDYTPPERPSVVIEGRIVPITEEAIKVLALNAMQLAVKK